MSSVGTMGIGVGEGHLRSSGVSGHLGGGKEGGYVSFFSCFLQVHFSVPTIIVSLHC